jgi:uroporphyrin-3 C-methyltransferase
LTDNDKRPKPDSEAAAASADAAGALTPAQAIEVARAAAAEQARQASEDPTPGNASVAPGAENRSGSEQPAGEGPAAEAADAGPVDTPGAGAAVRAPAPDPQPAPAARSSAGAESAPAPARTLATPIAWLALILVILLAVGGFTQLLELQRREAALLQRLQGLESVSGQDDTTFDQMRDNLTRQIELELEGIAARQTRAEEDQQRGVSRLETLVNQRVSAAEQTLDRKITEETSALQQRLRDQQQRINDLSVDDRQSWQLAEAQYLLRLANQRLIMTGDTTSAEALLRSADGILREVGDADLHDLREAVAADVAAVRAVPRLDTQGLYLRLEALIRQTDALVLFELPGRAPEVVVAPAEDWRGRLSQGLDAAVAKLSEYIVVSRRDVPVETLMDPQYEGLVRQNMRMLLEQAQVAMLSGNELLYRQSLERAEGWVTQFFKADQQAAQAMAEELRLLRDERVSVVLPDLSASLSALEAVMRARLAADGA